MSTTEILRLREYDKLEYSRIGEDGALRLERATATLGVPVFRFFRAHAQAQQYVGVVKAGRHTVEILPKIHEKDEENIGYLLSLLGYARKLKIRPNEIAEFEKVGGSFLEVLIRFFATELNRLLRMSYKHRYVETEDRLSFLRGKPLVERELDGTAKTRARYACRYEVFTPDHLLNRVLKFCNGILLRQTGVPSSRNTLRENDVFLSEVSHAPVTALDVDSIHLDRLSRDYEPILELCRLLLEKATLDLRTGRIVQLAFVFDMNVLFEEFVARFLDLHKDSIKLGGSDLVQVQAQKRLGKLFDEFDMKADLVLRDSAGRKFLLDTKYKLLQAGKDHGGLSQSDFYQMYAYGSAGEEDYDGIVLLYPTTASVAPIETYFRQGSVRLHVGRFDPKVIYDAEEKRMDNKAVIGELNKALSCLAASEVANS